MPEEDGDNGAPAPTQVGVDGDTGVDDVLPNS